MTEPIPEGHSVKLRCNTTPGLGGLSSFYLSENGYVSGNWVPVTEMISKSAGAVQLPSGKVLPIDIRDVQDVSA